MSSDHLTYDAYAALPGVRASQLKLLDSSPLHYRGHVDVDTTSRGKLRGIHSLTLEPDEFEAGYVMWEGDRRTKAYKEFAASVGNKTILTTAEWDTVHAVRDGIFRHPLAAAILSAPGESEVTIEWDDAATGLACKARLDRLVERIDPAWGLAPGGQFLITDLKTYGTSDPRIIARRVAQMHAHLQGAHYCDGLATVDSIAHSAIRYVLICAEDKPPFDVAVVELEFDNALALGRHERDRHMATLKTCIETDTWPGRCPALVPLDLPSWCDPDNDLEFTDTEDAT